MMDILLLASFLLVLVLVLFLYPKRKSETENKIQPEVPYKVEPVKTEEVAVETPVIQKTEVLPVVKEEKKKRAYSKKPSHTSSKKKSPHKKAKK